MRTTKSRLAFGVIGLGLLSVMGVRGVASSNLHAAQSDTNAQDRVPVVQWVGAMSSIEQERYVLVKDEPAWEELWRLHTAGEKSVFMRHQSPKIDFTGYMVVGVFLGTTTNTDGVVAKEVSEVKEGDMQAVRIRFERSTFQTASMGPGADQGMMTRPYGLWVVPKTDTGIVLEQGSMQLKGAEVQWGEVKRFEAGK